MDLLQKIENYWTLRADTYSETVNNSIVTNESEKWITVISKYVDHSKPLKILDVGTGPGFFPLTLGKMGHDVTGIDCTPEMLRIANINCVNSGVEATFLQMDAQNLDFEDESFDLVVSRNLVWNLENPKKAYGEWLRVLESGGKMIVFDGNHYLHLHDEEYRKGIKDHSDGHETTRYIGKADTYVMTEIARELPLSRERRPQWDMCTLLELGCKSISIDSERCDCICLDEGVVNIPHEFIICAEKR